MKSLKDKDKLEEMCKHISKREELSAKAQRDSIKYKQAEYLLDKIGKVFDGIVSGVSDWGMYVELIESKCEGMVRYQSLEGKWSVDTNNYTVTNEMGDKIRLGDALRVVVKSVDLERKQIDFTIF
jgi:ribonuclease R